MGAARLLHAAGDVARIDGKVVLPVPNGDGGLRLTGASAGRPARGWSSRVTAAFSAASGEQGGREGAVDLGL